MWPQMVILKESAAKAADILADITPEQRKRILNMTIGEETDTASEEPQETEYVYVTVVRQYNKPTKERPKEINHGI